MELYNQPTQTGKLVAVILRSVLSSVSWRPDCQSSQAQVGDVEAAAKATFATEIGETKYRPLLPPDQKPPIALNRELMEQFRPLMRPHYRKERPRFV